MSCKIQTTNDVIRRNFKIVVLSNRFYMGTYRISGIPRRRTRVMEHNNIIVIYDYINKNILPVYQSYNPSVCYSFFGETFAKLEILNKKK